MADNQVTAPAPARAGVPRRRVGPADRPRRDARSRLPAVGAGLAVLLGAVAMTISLVAAPGPWTYGYVSEAGTAGMPAATAYRAGLLLLGCGVMALGVALCPVSRPAAVLLGAAGVLAGTSGAVPCSTRCPLPPYESATAGDLAHTGAGILGMAALAFAMLYLAVAPRAPLRLRHWATGGAVATFPVAAVMAAAMLLAGRSPVTSGVERVLLAVAVCWLVGAAALTSASPAARRGTARRLNPDHHPAG